MQNGQGVDLQGVEENNAAVANTRCSSTVQTHMFSIILIQQEDIEIRSTVKSGVTTSSNS